MEPHKEFTVSNDPNPNLGHSNGQPPTEPVKTKLSLAAVVSFAFSMISLLVIIQSIFARGLESLGNALPTALIAVISGVLALSQIKKSPDLYRGRTLGRIGLIIGLIVFVISILGLILLLGLFVYACASCDYKY